VKGSLKRQSRLPHLVQGVLEPHRREQDGRSLFGCGGQGQGQRHDVMVNSDRSSRLPESQIRIRSEASGEGAAA
jgi:hypothetical protein